MALHFIDGQDEEKDKDVLKLWEEEPEKYWIEENKYKNFG